MASDIYARTGNNFNGAFAADAARVVFGGDVSGVGLLTQQLSVNYAQAVTRLYEIGTNFTYLIAGRTQGQVGMGRVLGPRPLQLGFYTKYGNVCNAATNNLNFEVSAGCTADTNGAPARFQLKNAVITNMGLSINAQDMLVNEQVNMLFISLELA